MSKQECDCLYEVPMSGAPLNVYLLFEHQSTVDGCMALRLLMYMTGIWQKVLKENPNGPFKLPSVVPVVLYQAADRWTAATEFSSVFDVSEGGMVRFIPKFDYALFDLGNTDPAEIPGPPQVQMVLRVMRAMYLEMDAYLKALESEVGPIDAALGEWTQEHTRHRPEQKDQECCHERRGNLDSEGRDTGS